MTAAGPDGTAYHRDLRTRWRAARVPVCIGLFVVLAGTLLGAFAQRTPPGLLDPTAPTAAGSRAVAELLRDRGTRVDVVGAAAEVRAGGAGATVLVPFPELMAPAQLRAVRESGADVVVVSPGQEVLAELATGVEVTVLRTGVDVLAPDCDLPAARRAGPVTLGGRLYSGGRGCYLTDDGAALVQVAASGGSGTVTVLGSPDILVNDTLAEEGNAALALALLGGNPRLLWFVPQPEGPPAGEERALTELIPPGWDRGSTQLLVAAVLLVLWRARRLGPVVREPLPVVVRSAEAVEGRARLYRRAGAAEHAARVLRGATRARLGPLIGLADPAEPAAVVGAVAARTGRTAAEVGALLYGPAPVDDAALITLADALDACETEVRRS